MQQFPIPNILSILTFLPLLGALVVMFLPRPKDLPEHHGDAHDDHGHAEAPEPKDSARSTVNFVALAFATVNFVLSVWLFMVFQSSYADANLVGPGRHMQFVENVKWISLGSIDIRYHMGIDGISLLLIVLTTFLMTLCVAFSGRTKQRLKEFMVFLLLLETGMIGVFCALDLVLFYVFWEAMLIPMYFLIGIFGHENRIYAAIKFFLYTFAGSIFMLIAIVAVYQITGTFDVMALSDHSKGAGLTLAQYDPRLLMYLYGAFALAFMIKVPMFPFHTWLPDAHVEAPTAGSVILAGVMLKMGTYGFIRFCLPMFPAQAQQSAPLFITLAIIGIVYGSIVAAVQPDAKKLVAYSSVAHLGFVVLGIFTFNRIGMMGALIQNINHGISTPMLFFIVGMLYERRHTREISEFGGLKMVTPMLATMLLLATLSSIAVPFFNGFVGEFTILMGSWMSTTTGFWPTAFAATGMILSAVYMLWWFQRLMLGPVTRPVNRHLPDLKTIEWGVLVPLTGMVFWIGLGSNFWTQRMDASVNTLLPAAMENLDPTLPTGEKMAQERIEEVAGKPRSRAPKSAPTPTEGTRENAPQQAAPNGGAPGATQSTERQADKSPTGEGGNTPSGSASQGGTTEMQGNSGTGGNGTPTQPTNPNPGTPTPGGNPAPGAPRPVPQSGTPRPQDNTDPNATKKTEPAPAVPANPNAPANPPGKKTE